MAASSGAVSPKKKHGSPYTMFKNQFGLDGGTVFYAADCSHDNQLLNFNKVWNGLSTAKKALLNDEYNRRLGDSHVCRDSATRQHRAQQAADARERKREKKGKTQLPKWIQDRGSMLATAWLRGLRGFEFVAAFEAWDKANSVVYCLTQADWKAMKASDGRYIWVCGSMMELYWQEEARIQQHSTNVFFNTNPLPMMNEQLSVSVATSPTQLEPVGVLSLESIMSLLAAPSLDATASAPVLTPALNLIQSNNSELGQGVVGPGPIVPMNPAVYDDLFEILAGNGPAPPVDIQLCNAVGRTDFGDAVVREKTSTSNVFVTTPNLRCVNTLENDFPQLTGWHLTRVHAIVAEHLRIKALQSKVSHPPATAYAKKHVRGGIVWCVRDDEVRKGGGQTLNFSSAAMSGRNVDRLSLALRAAYLRKWARGITLAARGGRGMRLRDARELLKAATPSRRSAPSPLCCMGDLVVHHRMCLLGTSPQLSLL
ncbi:hypothetical protein BKA62DRAFT_676250 [Auriculariales sp. MPI-PUGE-AT-0066]|nr:hypothetical protein BKA62DRAFT_676250 [Auriculariales sp. MPI-PUGE-AT-0066]